MGLQCFAPTSFACLSRLVPTCIAARRCFVSKEVIHGLVSNMDKKNRRLFQLPDLTVLFLGVFTRLAGTLWWPNARRITFSASSGLHMWADTDTDVDFLNYPEVAQLIAEMIARPELPPLSLGVFGSWASASPARCVWLRMSFPRPKTSISSSPSMLGSIRISTMLVQR